MDEKNTTFEYTYSARQQEEIRSIREKYVKSKKNSEDKLTRLRQLDNSVYTKAITTSLVVGILSTLVLGIGMCCCMVWNKMAIGCIIGMVGIGGISMAYPAYVYVTKSEREKISDEVIKLTDELMMK